MNKQRAANYVPDSIFAGGVVDMVGRGENRVQAGFGFEFINALNVPVVAMTRTGVKYVIPPMTGQNLKGFVVRTNYSAKGHVNVDTHDLLNDSGHATTDEAGFIAKAVRRDETFARAAARPHSGMVDYVVPFKAFEDHGGTLYLPNLDVTLSILTPDQAPPHPYSLVGMRQYLGMEQREQQGKAGVVVQIRIIDSQGQFGSRFVNLGGEVFHIQAERGQSDMQDGVYAIGSYPAPAGASMPGNRTQYFKFDEAEKALSLYQTFNEAKTLGNPQDVYKRELEERNQALKQREHEHEEQKANWRREADERRAVQDREAHESKMRLMDREEKVSIREAEATRFEQENRMTEQRLKFQQLVLKDVYENRANDRKETIEILKHLPLLIGGVAAIFVAVKKLKG